MLALLTGLIVLAQQDIDDARLQAACGEEPGPICTAVLRLTGQDWLAAILTGAVRILIILVVAYVLNRLLRRAVKRFVRGLTEQGVAKLSVLRSKAPLADTRPMDLARARMRFETVGAVLRSIGTFAIWSIAMLMILATFDINLGPLIAGAGIAGVALGFGAQKLVQDFLAGIFILLEDQYGIGDIVDVGDARGTIEAVTLRTTRLRDVEGTVWHVPNGQINRIANMSQQWARSLLDVGVAYDTDVDHATRVMKQVADEMWQDEEWGDLILDEPDVWGLQDFAADQLTLRIVIKTVPGKQFPVNREYRARLKAAFDAEGIEIPFPQRTVWVRQDGAESGNGAEDPFTPKDAVPKARKTRQR